MAQGPRARNAEEARLKPTLRTAITQGITYGTWCILPSPEVVHVLAHSALDFLLLDQEHGALDLPLLQRCVHAAHAGSTPVVVRLPRLDACEVGRVLDTGADGILIPHVETRADVEALVQAACFPPGGTRGYSPYTPAFGYAPKPGALAAEDEKVTIGALIESRRGLENLADICAEPRLDFIYLGAYDLSVSLGVPGDIQHPRVTEALREASSIAQRLGKPVAAIFHNPEQLPALAELGIPMRVYSVDTAVLRRTYDAVAAWRN